MCADRPHHPREMRKDVPDVGTPARGSVAEPVVPCGPEFDPDEARRFGGIAASRLAGLATRLVRTRSEQGVGAFHRIYAHLSAPIRHALYIYSRVKEAMAALSAPQETIIHVHRGGKLIRARRRPWSPKGQPRSSTAHVSPCPKDWDVEDRSCGYDVRGTSLGWVQHRVEAARSRARRAAREDYITEGGLIRQRPRPARPPVEMDSPCRSESQDFTLGEIWPPVPVEGYKGDITVTLKAPEPEPPTPTEPPNRPHHPDNQGRLIGYACFDANFTAVETPTPAAKADARAPPLENETLRQAANQKHKLGW